MKSLKEMLDANDRYHDEEFKGPKIAHHCAQGVLFGSTAACPACSQRSRVALSLSFEIGITQLGRSSEHCLRGGFVDRALVVCPFVDEIHCEGHVDGCSQWHLLCHGMDNGWS